MEDILENGSKSSSDLVTGDKIKAVRKETRAGTIDCRKALESTGGDVQKAVEYLRERNIGTPKKVWT
jgi:translation elongation factor EF-Ts